jgi:hypothetical protein
MLPQQEEQGPPAGTPGQERQQLGPGNLHGASAALRWVASIISYLYF